MPRVRVPFTVSFDALGTLIDIKHGMGYQYRSSYSDFLLEYGLDLEATCPRATCEKVQQLALRAIHDQVCHDRASWKGSTNPKEMPIGGVTKEELRSFWYPVLQKTFRDASLYEDAASSWVRRVVELWDSNDHLTRQFLDRVIFDQFASTKAYQWLPNGLKALQSLREWNQGQEDGDGVPSQRSAVASEWARSSSSADHNGNSVVPFLAAPPFVISNMDSRLHHVFAQLGAFEPGPNELPPLLSRVITPQDTGYAKPSPAGLLMGVGEIKTRYDSHHLGAAEASTSINIHMHVHVGDAEADRRACERAGCLYVQCDQSTGATWDALRAKLRELETSRSTGPVH